MDGRRSVLLLRSLASSGVGCSDDDRASAKSIVAEWLRGKQRSAPSAINADAVGPTDFDLSVGVAVALCLSICLLIRHVQFYRYADHLMVCQEEEKEEEGEVKEIMMTPSPMKIKEQKALQLYTRKSGEENEYSTLLSFARKFPVPQTPVNGSPRLRRAPERVYSSDR